MREDQELLIPKSDHRRFRQLLGLDHAIDTRDAPTLGASRHVGSNRLGAEDGYLDSTIAVGDGKPFSKRDGGMFGDGVGSRADLGEKTRGRTGIQQVSLAAFQHRRKQCMGGIDMGHDVDVPDSIPGLDVDLRAAGDRNPRIRHKEVDRTAICLDFTHQRFDLGSTSDIDPKRFPTDGFRDLGGVGLVEIHDRDSRGALLRKALTERSPDPVCATRYHDIFARNFHRLSPLRYWNPESVPPLPWCAVIDFAT